MIAWLKCALAALLMTVALNGDFVSFVILFLAVIVMETKITVTRTQR